MSRRPKTINERPSAFNNTLIKDSSKLGATYKSSVSADAVFNTTPYKASDLTAAGMHPLKAARFEAEHRFFADYLSQSPVAVEIFSKLTQCVSNHIESSKKELRNVSLVSYAFTTTILIAFMGILMGYSSIKKWVLTINSNISIRAMLTAMFPQALPPTISYDYHSVYRVVSMFAGVCYGTMDAGGKHPRGGMKALHIFFKTLRLFQAPPNVDLFSYAPLHGFMKGLKMSFSTPRFVVIGFDGQELRASFLPIDGSSCRNYNLVNLYDCTHMRIVDFVLKTKKSHEVEAFLEMLDALVEDGFDLSNVVFIADALNTNPKVVEAIEAARAYYILTLKTNQGNGGLRTIIDKRFQDVHEDEVMSFVSPKQKDHGRIERVTIKAMSVQQLESKPDLFKPELLSATMNNKVAKYPSMKSVIKYDKDTVEYRNSYSKEALDKLNAQKAKEDEKDLKRHSIKITNIDLDDEGFKKIICALNDGWMYEVAHNHTDENLRQDRLQLSNRSMTELRVSLNKIALDFSMFVREGMMASWNSISGHYNKRPQPVGEVFAAMTDPTNFIDCFCAFMRPLLLADGDF